MVDVNRCKVFEYYLDKGQLLEWISSSDRYHRAFTATLHASLVHMEEYDLPQEVWLSYSWLVMPIFLEGSLWWYT